jgi:abnormal spindle-like microcephaly-associated protein
LVSGGTNGKPQIKKMITTAARVAESIPPEIQTMNAPRVASVAKSSAIAVAGVDGRGWEGRKKYPRRKAILIPSDDTTMLAIQPGMQNAGDTTDLSLISQQADVHGRTMRKSLAIGPRHVLLPLQPTLKPLQETSHPADLPGRPTGKENTPPDWKHGLMPAKECSSSISCYAQIALPAVRKPLMPATHQNAARRREVSNNNDHIAKRNACPASLQVPRCSLSNRSAWTGSKRSTQTIERPPAKPIKPAILKPDVYQYPLLLENIPYPEMYEEAWLSNLESAVTELINKLFQIVSIIHPSPQGGTLRQKMMRLYQEPSMLLLYKRIQASLRYGALSLANGKESIPRASQFLSDVGIRRKFIQLWVKTYDTTLLRAAVEVVVGREATSSTNFGHPPESKAGLESFIESCLMRNEDVVHQTTTDLPTSY